MTEPIEPVVVAVEVRRGIEEAFQVFTAEIAAWWPVAEHSVEPDRVEAVVLEAGVGGRLYERWHDGGRADWARVLAWEPPARLLLSWHPNPDRPAPTEVEVRFQAVEPHRTRVELVHRGWERLGDQGRTSRAGYETGCPGTLEAFAATAVDGAEAASSPDWNSSTRLRPSPLAEQRARSAARSRLSTSPQSSGRVATPKPAARRS